MSEDLPFYHHAHHPPAPARTKRPGERLWELRRSDQRARGGLVYHTNPIGFEFQLYVEGHFIEGRRFGSSEAAIEHGERIRDDYVRDGWHASQ